MIIRTWIGGGNNKASNANDWTPSGTPQPGDTLIMLPGTTMNVSGNDLAGNALAMQGNNTLNVKDASISSVGGGGVVNISGQSTANVVNETVNVSSNSQWTGSLDGGTVNLGTNAAWIGTFVSGSVTGGSRSVFLNTGNSSVTGTRDLINVPVAGNGTFEVLTSDLIFGQTVGAGQDIHILGLGFGIGGTVQVNQPLSFSASVTLQSTSTPVFGAGSPEIDLIGLAHADSYSFQHDMLSIFSGNSVIDTLHMHDGTLYGFVVQQASAGVSVIGIDDPANPPPGGLPIHT